MGKRHVLAGVLAVCIAMGAGVQAQSVQERAIEAFHQALDAPGDPDALRAVQANLLAILAQDPGSALAQAILAVPRGQEMSLLQKVQMQLAAQEEPSPPAFASCTRDPRILDLAERIMQQRIEVGGFGQANYGTEAAYLWLRYAEPAFDAGMARLEKIAGEGRRGPRQIDDLKLAYAYANLPYEQALTRTGNNSDAIFRKLRHNAFAALIASDDGRTFFALLQKADRDGGFEERNLINLTLPQMLYHLPDDRKQALAEAAEATGDLPFALLMLAAARDLSAYHSFVERHLDDAQIAAFPIDVYGGTALFQTRPTQLHPRQTPRNLAQSKFDILRAGLLLGEADFINILYNQTGWEAGISAAAAEFLRKTESGEMRSIGALERNWVFVYDEVAARQDPQELRQQMSSFDISTKVRHYAGSAQDTTDWMRAVEVTRPFLRGEVDQLPTQLALMSDGFDWTGWYRLARLIKAEQVPLAQTPVQMGMVAELLVAAGREDQAVAFAQDHMAVKQRLTFYRDLMKRLDRACAAYSSTPGQSILLGGLTAYRFD